VILAGAAPSGRHVKGTPVRWGRLGTTYALGWPEGVHAGQERLGLLGSHLRIFRPMAGPDVCYKPNSCRRTQSTQRVRRSQPIALALVFAVAVPLRSICSCRCTLLCCLELLDRLLEIDHSISSRFVGEFGSLRRLSIGVNCRQWRGLRSNSIAGPKHCNNGNREEKK
jgi:hypothetical protein